MEALLWFLLEGVSQVDVNIKAARVSASVGLYAVVPASLPGAATGSNSDRRGYLCHFRALSIVSGSKDSNICGRPVRAAAGVLGHGGDIVAGLYLLRESLPGLVAFLFGYCAHLSILVSLVVVSVRT